MKDGAPWEGLGTVFQSRWSYWLQYTLAIGIFGASAVVQVLSAAPGSDEGFYLEAARSSGLGRMPYRDFAFSQMPLLPLIDGLLLRLTAPGLLEMRALSAAWALLGLTALFASARRLAPGIPPILIVLVPACSPGWVSEVSRASTYGLASFFLSLSMLLASGESSGRRQVAALSASILAVLTRLATLPFYGILWAGLCLRRRSRAFLLASVGFPLGLAGLIMLPFLVGSPRSVWFWNVVYHMETSFRHRGLTVALEAFWVSRSLAFVVALAVTSLWLSRRERMDNAGLLFTAALAGIVVNLVLKAPYGTYITPFVGPCAAAGMALAWNVLCGRKGRLVAIAVLLAGVVTGMKAGAPTNPAAVDDMKLAAAVLKRIVPPRSTVISSCAEVVIEAGMTTYPGLEMGMFSTTEELSLEEARRYHLTTYDDLVSLLKSGRAGPLVIHRDHSWDFVRSVPSLRPVSASTLARLGEAIDTMYRPIHSGGTYLVLIPRPRSAEERH